MDNIQMKRLISFTVFLLIISAQLIASGKITIIDSLNRTIILNKVPERIVIAGKGGFMIINAAFFFKEAVSKLVAYPKNSQLKQLPYFYKLIDPNYENKISIETNTGIEEFAALKPDVILLKEYEKNKYLKKLNVLGIKTVFFNLESPEKFAKDITNLGKLFNNSKKAEKIISFFNKWQNVVKNNVKKRAGDKPKVLLVFYSERDGGVSFNVSPKNWIQVKMIEMSGGIPVWKNINLGHGWHKISFDQIAAWDPDYIFITSYFSNVEVAKKNILENQFWKLLKAYKNNHIYAFPEDFISWDQPDSRWILGLYWVCMRLNGKITETEKNQFTQMYNTFYRLYSLSDKQIKNIKISGDLF